MTDWARATSTGSPWPTRLSDLTPSIRERLNSPYVQSNYDEKTSPYAKFKQAEEVTPAREAYELRNVEQLSSRWGSDEVERVAAQRSPGDDGAAVVVEAKAMTPPILSAPTEVAASPVPTVNGKKRPLSPLRAAMDS